MRRWIFYTFVLFVVFGTDSNANSQLYTLSDLEILEQEKNTNEFLAHALDVKPQLRNKHYQEMVEHMAILHVKNLINKRLFNPEHYSFLEEISEWPLLQADAFFQSKRNDYMRLYFDRCFQKDWQTNHLNCESKLYRFWHNSNFDPDLGIHFLETLSEKSGHKPEFWDFIKAAVKSPQSEYFCKKEKVLDFISYLIQQMDSSYKSDKDFHKNIKSKYNIDCLKQIYPNFHYRLGHSVLNDKKHIFRFLSVFNQLSREQKMTYFAEVFLATPYPSKSFNQAWNTIKELGQNHQVRLNVLKQLEGKDLLPGEVFNLKSKLRSTTLIKFLYQNFPEYIDFYSRTCINYMSGKSVYPSGNPTPHCNRLFQTHSKYLDSGLINSYKDIKKASFSRGL